MSKGICTCRFYRSPLPGKTRFIMTKSECEALDNRRHISCKWKPRHTKKPKTNSKMNSHSTVSSKTLPFYAQALNYLLAGFPIK